MECVGRVGNCLVLLKFTVYLPFSSVLFFLVYSLIFYSNIFEYGRLPVECVGMFFVSVCVGSLGDCLVLLTFTIYLPFSSVLFVSRIFFNIIFLYIRVWAVACGMCRYVFYRCVSVAWVVASFCLNALSIFSSRLFSSFLVYSLISYSSIFEHGRLPVECIGMFFIGVCRVLGRLPRFAYNHCLSSLLVCSLLFSYIL